MVWYLVTVLVEDFNTLKTRCIEYLTLSSKIFLEKKLTAKSTVDLNNTIHSAYLFLKTNELSTFYKQNIHSLYIL